MERHSYIKRSRQRWHLSFRQFQRKRTRRSIKWWMVPSQEEITNIRCHAYYWEGCFSRWDLPFDGDSLQPQEIHPSIQSPLHKKIGEVESGEIMACFQMFSAGAKWLVWNQFQCWERQCSRGVDNLDGVERNYWISNQDYLNQNRKQNN